MGAGDSLQAWRAFLSLGAFRPDRPFLPRRALGTDAGGAFRSLGPGVAAQRLEEFGLAFAGIARLREPRPVGAGAASELGLDRRARGG